MFSWVGYRDLSRIYSALSKKVKKYTIFFKQYIFISDNNLIRSEEYKEIHSKMAEIQNEYPIRFDSIFLYLYGGILIEFDMINSSTNSYSVSDNKVLADKAYHMAHSSL